MKQPQIEIPELAETTGEFSWNDAGSIVVLEDCTIIRANISSAREH